MSLRPGTATLGLDVLLALAGCSAQSVQDKVDEAVDQGVEQLSGSVPISWDTVCTAYRASGANDAEQVSQMLRDFLGSNGDDIAARIPGMQDALAASDLPDSASSDAVLGFISQQIVETCG